MQPTVPAWVSWYRRLLPEPSQARGAPRASRASRARGRSLAPHRLAVYTFARDEPGSRLIRLESASGRSRMAAGMSRGPPRLADTGPWRLAVPLPLAVPVTVPGPLNHPVLGDTRFQYEPISLMLPPVPTEAPAMAAGGARAGWGAVRGWGAGTALLAILLLLVRSAEKCLDKKLRHQNQNPESGPPGEDPEAVQETRVDLPPPYSECANDFDPNKITSEEPPPPYSACYVSFSNPKDGIPSVHFYNRTNENVYEIGHSSSENMDNNVIDDSNAQGSPNAVRSDDNEANNSSSEGPDLKGAANEVTLDLGETSAAVSASVGDATQDRAVTV